MADETTTETAEAATSVDSTGAAKTRAVRKIREGVVTSAAMDKTIIVTVTERVRHMKYKKTVLQTKKLHTHDEANDAKVGDRVRVMETRPLSKTKRWRLVDVLERAR
jgi:small subunit ribosomal protein S17